MLDPLHEPALIALRTRIFAEGICAGDFSTLLERDDAAFQKVFGQNVLIKIEFDVAFIGEHSHLIHVPASGAPQAITAYPMDGKLRIEGPKPWRDSQHSPENRTAGEQRIAIIAGRFGEAEWRRIVIVAKALDEAGLNYNFLFQNSNSVVATLLESVRMGFVDLPGGGLNIGSGNTLFDELMGGSQAPRLLIRGGTSHSGASNSPAPRQLPESSSTDG